MTTGDFGPRGLPPCALAIADEALSTWRDGLADANDDQRLRQHVPSCASCQNRLRNLDSLGRVLLAQRTPDLQDRVWRGLQVRLAAGSGNRSRGGAALGLAAGLAAALVVALFATVLLRHGAGPTGPASGTATAGYTPVATPSGPVPDPSVTASATAAANWVQVQQNIACLAVAPSDPRTVYACAPAGGVDAFGILVLNDDGTTRGTAGSPAATYDFPLLTVNPTNPRDLVLASQSNQGSADVYRSKDGGSTWTHEDAVQNTLQTLGWAGSNLLIQTSVVDTGGPGDSRLYLSADGGPFTRLDQDSMLGGMDLRQNHVRLVGGTAGALYVQFAQFDQPVYDTTLRSTDGGVHWSKVTFKDAAGRLVHLFSISPTGQLLGVYDDNLSQLTISTDGGQTWRSSVPPLPGTDQLQRATATPDGTLFAATGGATLYMLAPGAQSWRAVPQPPTTTASYAAIWDASSGRPTALLATPTQYATPGTLWRLPL